MSARNSFIPEPAKREPASIAANPWTARRVSGEDLSEGRTMRTPGLLANWSTLGPRLQSVLRIVAALMFIVAGTIILFAFPMGMPPNGGTAPLTSQIGFGGALELVGGSLLLLGLFTRPVAFVLSGLMAVAYFQFHAPQGFWPNLNNGIPAVLYCFLWLYFSAAGPGSWSLDALIRRKRGAARVG